MNVRGLCVLRTQSPRYILRIVMYEERHGKLRKSGGLTMPSDPENMTLARYHVCASHAERRRKDANELAERAIVTENKI